MKREREIKFDLTECIPFDEGEDAQPRAAETMLVDSDASPVLGTAPPGSAANQASSLPPAMFAEIKGLFKESMLHMEQVALAGRQHVDQSVQGLQVKLETRFGALEAQTNKLSELQQKQEERLKRLEDGAAKGGGTRESGSTASSSGSGGRRAGWTPKFVWLRNFCAFDEKNTQGITRADAEVLLASLREHTPEMLRASIGNLHLDAIKNYRVKVAVGDGHCEEIAGIWRELLASNKVGWQDRPLTAKSEHSPEDQYRYSTTGKLLNWVKEDLRRPEAVSSWWPDFHVLIKDGDGYEVALATVRADGSVHWDEELLLQVSNLSVRDAQRRSASYRRQR